MAQPPNRSHPRAWVRARVHCLECKETGFFCPCCGQGHTIQLNGEGVPDFPVTVTLFCQRCACHVTVEIDGVMPPAKGEAMAVNRPEVRKIVAGLERTLEAEPVRLVDTPIGSAPATSTAPPEPPRRGLLTWLGDLLFPWENPL